MTPVYPLLVAGVFRVFGVYTFPAWVGAAGANIIFCVLACLPIFFAGKRLGGPGVGATAAWLWAVFPNAILIPVESMWEASLAALLGATILWATLALGESRRTLDWCAYGLLWGFALMTEAAFASLLPLLLAWLAYRVRRDRVTRSWFGKPALAGAIALLCCVPWTIRNYEVFHVLVPLRSILGLQLYVGNNPQAKETWLGENHPIHDQAERGRYIQLGEIAYTQAKMHDAIQYMLTHPLREAHLIAYRFIAFWAGGTPHPAADFLHDHSAQFRGVLLFNLLVAVGAFWGIIALCRARNVYAFPLAVFPIVYPCAYYLTLALPRYSLPIDPIVMLLTAVALNSLRPTRPC